MLMSDMGRLVLFHSGLDTLDLFSGQLQQGFEALGYKIFTFDLGQSALSLGKLYDYIRDGRFQHAFFRHEASLRREHVGGA